MVRKGQMHVIDAIAAVMVLLFFSVTNFGSGVSNDWTSFENEIGTQDLSYTMQNTGYIKEFVKSGETGSLESALTSVSERSLRVSGEIQGIAPNLHIGMYTRPSQVQNANVEEVESGDRCYGELQELQDRSSAPILKTVAGAGNMESQHDGIRLYMGDFNNADDTLSELEYDALWIDTGTECEFSRPSNPVMIDETFEWGNSNSEIFEFKGADVDTTIWEGTITLAEGEQLQRFEETMDKPVKGVDNKVKIDTFTFNQNLEEYDFFIFRDQNTLSRIENDYKDRAANLIQDKPVLFLTDLDSSYLEEGDLLYEQGFRWQNLDYENKGSTCSRDDPTTISSGCDLPVSFSDAQSSQTVRDHALGLKTDFDQVSLYPSGSIAFKDEGPLSFEKTMYLENWAHEELSKDRIQKSMSAHTASGRPSTACNNATTASFTFPLMDGSTENLDVVNTQLGEASYCDQNNRALYIDIDDDGEYQGDDEGPYLNGEQVEINDITYTVRIYSRLESGCGLDNCAGFILDENAKLSIFDYNNNKEVGRASYENRYSEDDRKAIASFIYMMAGSNQLTGTIDEDSLNTNIHGNTGLEAYEANLGWSN